MTTQLNAMKQALEALEKVTREMLAVRDELAERGARPVGNVFHQRLWDSSFDAYTNHALPAAQALRTAIEAAEKQEPAPVQEPVAYKPPAKWTDAEIKDGYRGIRWVTADGVYGRPTEEDVARYLGYTTPPAAQRQWVGLSEEEILKLAYPIRWQEVDDFEADKAVNFAQAIEAKLKEKNGITKKGGAA